MKTAVVTGAAGGMGYATARLLAQEGYRVFALDVKEAPETQGVTFIRADLTSGEDVEEARRRVEAACERVDALVNMAGIYDLDSLAEMPEEALKRIFDVNVFAAFRVNKAFLPLMPPGGRIVITSSELAPLDPLPFTGVYAVTKSAAEKYAFALRMEVQLTGQQVIVLRPGAVDTGLLTVSTQRLDAFCGGTKRYAVSAQRFRRIVDRVEARRIPPQRVANLTLRALEAASPRYVYAVNRNPLLMLMGLLPARWQCGVIKKILTARTAP